MKDESPPPQKNGPSTYHSVSQQTPDTDTAEGESAMEKVAQEPPESGQRFSVLVLILLASCFPRRSLTVDASALVRFLAICTPRRQGACEVVAVGFVASDRAIQVTVCRVI
jgi:hypothetical protein